MSKKKTRSKRSEYKTAKRTAIALQSLPDIALPFVSVILLAAAETASAKFRLSDFLVVAMFLVPYILSGFDTARNALINTLEGHHFSYEMLILAATVGAFCIGEYTDAVIAMIAFKFGVLLEELITKKSRRALSRFSAILPEYAYIDDGKGLFKVSPESIRVGTVITVCPGDRIPLDGIVVRGSSKIDASDYTGCKEPITAAAGHAVISGCRNVSDYIEVSVTKSFNNSTAKKMTDYSEKAARRRANIDSSISKVTRILNPVLIFAAIAITIIFSVVSMDWASWIMKGLIIISVASPYVLSVSIPMCYYSGIGSAINSGIFFKGPKYIDLLSKLHTVALDKTGTVTNGSFSVIGVEPIGISSEDLITLAAAAECFSKHPIAIALKRVCRNMPDRSLITDVVEVPGRGIQAKVCGRNVLVGNSALMTSNSITPGKFSGTATVVHVAADGIYGGYIIIDDRVKPGAKQALRDMYALGVEKAVLLTGDSEETGTAIGQALGVSDVMSELLPDDKSTAVKELQREKAAGTLAFIGDGVNDAAAFEKADIGIAMGVIGAGTAIGEADVVIMDDNIVKMPLAIDISKHTISAAKLNAAFCVIAKLAITVLGLLGIITLGIAVIADTLLLLLALLNANRVYNIK